MLLSPTMAPASTVSDRGAGAGEHWRNFDNTVNAVSFGFVATAILVSMFLAMAIFERFLRPTTAAADGGGLNHGDIEAQTTSFNGKLNYPFPKNPSYGGDLSVLMPGEEVPTFIAHPVQFQTQTQTHILN
ncbi:uncharacterized protein LOC124940724 [Impatiens glandulifera]|uniref:uncharacterized protein LOC124940724 n=1 Tax=Impatiens glandulifera TaxID=253017 RepID=UPI001FB10967|nr:uncharacterized protein LOC124940724 [Impatiens glandulifera]